MPKRPTLPEPGDVFLMPLEGGRLGVCRVLCTEAARGRVRALIAASPWVGDAAPDLADPELREVLTLSHHAWGDRQALIWVAEPPPASFTRIGNLPPSEDESRRTVSGAGAWPWLSIQVHSQWRWDHEREAVLAEDERARQAMAASRAEEERRRRERLAGLTLDGLRAERRFAGWEGHVPTAALEATRAIFVETIDAVAALGPGAAEEQILAALQGCIEALNRLDARHRFIETLEREALCDAFDEVVHAAGLGHLTDLADRWREW